MARFYAIECSNFGYSIIDSSELSDMQLDGEKPCILKGFNDIEDARNFIDDLEGKQAQSRCLGNEL